MSVFAISSSLAHPEISSFLAPAGLNSFSCLPLCVFNTSSLHLLLSSYEQCACCMIRQGGINVDVRPFVCFGASSNRLPLSSCGNVCVSVCVGGGACVRMSVCVCRGGACVRVCA